MNCEKVTSKQLSGFIKIARIDPNTGETTTLVDKSNMLMKAGSTLIAYCLSGKPNANIWGMYVGYNNSVGSFDLPAVDSGYSVPFLDTGLYGYIREPLTFEPTFLSTTTYTDNVALFSTMITSANNVLGADLVDGTSKLFEVGLVAALDRTSAAKDRVFSRTQFNNITYNANYNLNIVWGIKIDL